MTQLSNSRGFSPSTALGASPAILGILAFFVIALITSAMGLAQTKRSDANTKKNTEDDVIPKINQRLLARAVIAADRYRQAVAWDPKHITGNWTTAEFQKTWAKNIIPKFKGQEWQIKHFFGFAVIIPGSMDSGGAIVACYNPWLDVVLVQRWELRMTDEKLAEAAFVTGNYLRGEKLGKKQAIPSWMLQGESKEKAVAEFSAKTVRAFQKMCPMAKKAPNDLSKLLWNTGKQKEEQFTAIQARMLFREAYKGQVFDVGTLKAAQEAAATVKRLLVAGKLSSLLSVLSPKQDKYVAQTATRLPKTVRSSLVAQWYLKGDKNALVFLGSPLAPRFFVAVSVSYQSQGAKPKTIFVYDFSINRKDSPANGKRGEVSKGDRKTEDAASVEEGK